VAICAIVAAGCESDDSPTRPSGTPRTYSMGWSPSPLRPDINAFFAVVDSMADVSDVAILQQPVPWPELLSGAPMDSIVTDRANVAAYLRNFEMDIVFLVDPLDGLDRRKEDPGLTGLGRSILEPEIRAIHEEWVRRIATRIRPAYLGLASEINTLAARGDSALNAEITGLVNTLAPQIRAASPNTRVFVSFQADEALGLIPDPGFDHFALIDAYDIDALGLSSYPVFFFDTPADMPDDYFGPFRDATGVPLLLVEGGWSSARTQLLDGTPQEQAEFFTRFETYLDAVDAELFVLLNFTDIDVPSLGLDPDRAAGLSNFAHMGIMDVDLNRKPAYAEWTRIFSRPR
jgi:hypothetical protein